jgi:peptidylprolyl isomerase
MPYILSPGETFLPKEFEEIVKLLLADGGGKRNKPLAAEELLQIGREAFEPLFHEPPLGPIPDYLKPHTSVYGCVAEYEEKLEELERWKVQKLELWLKNEVGEKFTAGEKVYELSRERGEPSAPDKYWLKLIEDRDRETKEGEVAQAKSGDRVIVHYSGSLEDGTIFSSTYEEDEPFAFTIGEANVLPSFQNAVIGMNEGETKTISVPPEDGYGEHKTEFVLKMERDQAPPNLELELGKRLQIRLNDGTTRVVTVLAITEDSVILDANDPLAGKTLQFEIELIQIITK